MKPKYSRSFQDFHPRQNYWPAVLLLLALFLVSAVHLS
jgi:hypothetical protein